MSERKGISLEEEKIRENRKFYGPNRIIKGGPKEIKERTGAHPTSSEEPHVRKMYQGEGGKGRGRTSTPLGQQK